MALSQTNYEFICKLFPGCNGIVPKKISIDQFKALIDVGETAMTTFKTAHISYFSEGRREGQFFIDPKELVEKYYSFWSEKHSRANANSRANIRRKYTDPFWRRIEQLLGLKEGHFKGFGSVLKTPQNVVAVPKEKAKKSSFSSSGYGDVKLDNLAKEIEFIEQPEIKVKAMANFYDAIKKKKELDIALGRVVDAKEIEKQIASAFSQVRSALLDLPKKLSKLIVGRDINEAEVVMAEEITKALEGLSSLDKKK